MEMKVASPTSSVKAPIVVASQLTLPLQNRQVKRGRPGRIVRATLRAASSGSPKNDYVRVAVEGHGGELRCQFAKCVAFYRDGSGGHFLGVQWLERAQRRAVDPTAKIAKLELAPTSRPSSFDIVPVGSILNGALILEFSGACWAIQSPREEEKWLLTSL